MLCKKMIDYKVEGKNLIELYKYIIYPTNLYFVKFKRVINELMKNNVTKFCSVRKLFSPK